MSTQPIYAIKDKAPEFPCWLWGTVSRGWIRFQESEMHRNHEYGEPLWTHWHPDAPTAPTARPQAEVPEWAKEAMGELVELYTIEGNPVSILPGARVIARHAPAAAAPDAQLREDYQKVVLTLAAFDLQYHRLLRIAQKVLVYQSPNTSSTVSVPRSVTEDLAVVCNEKTPEWPAPSAAAPSSEGPSDAEMLDWWIASEKTLHAMRPPDDDPDRRSIYWLSGTPLDKSSRSGRQAIRAAMQSTEGRS